MSIPDFYSMTNKELMEEWAPGLTYLGGGDDYDAMHAKLGIEGDWKGGDNEHYQAVSVAFYAEIDRRAPAWIRFDSEMDWQTEERKDEGLWLCSCYEEMDAWWWVDKEDHDLGYQFHSIAMDSAARDACIRYGLEQGYFDQEGAEMRMHLGRGEMVPDMDAMREIAEQFKANT